MRQQAKYAIIFLVIFTVITGLIYPLVVTGVSQLFLRDKANGSVIEKNGTPLGSELIGQHFSDPKYFWGRLSATSIAPYNAAASSGSNLGPANPELRLAIQARIDALNQVDPNNSTPIPIDLVTFSGSGLDPDISIAAADYQVGRVARYRGLNMKQVADLVKSYTKDRQFGFLGEPRVNILQLNLALDNLE